MNSNSHLNNQSIHPTVIGENGTAEYSSQQVGEVLVALFFALVRNIPHDRLLSLVDECLQQADRAPAEAPRILSDLFILAFHTRDCRGGKGERNLFYQLLLRLYDLYPLTVISLLPLIGEYGYYKDYFNLLSEISMDSKYDPLKDRILDLIANKLIADEMNFQKWLERQHSTSDANESGVTKRPRISLCAKYAPREGNKFQETHKALFRELLLRLFPDTPFTSPDSLQEVMNQKAYQRMKQQYRLLISKLTAVIDVPEVKMCRKRYAEINFKNVPSLCLKKYRKAFANEDLKKPLTPATKNTGNRYPEDPDRVACRNHLLLAIHEEKVNGKQTFPHEIVKVILSRQNRRLSDADQVLFQAQWEEIRKQILQQIASNHSKSKNSPIGFNNLVPMVDVSGSMAGTPLQVAIALGILISEVTHPAFRNRVLTFDCCPRWVNPTDCPDITTKVRLLQEAPWGANTNLEAALACIERAIEGYKLTPEEIPALIIFSDMQFDAAIYSSGTSMSTQLRRIDQRFIRLGNRVFGHALPRPRIIFWNLRGDTTGFPATAETDNVQMLSGFSPSLFKHLLEGKNLTEIMTPYFTFRSIIDDRRYDAVRTILAESREGYFASAGHIKQE